MNLLENNSHSLSKFVNIIQKINQFRDLVEIGIEMI